MIGRTLGECPLLSAVGFSVAEQGLSSSVSSSCVIAPCVFGWLPPDWVGGLWYCDKKYYYIEHVVKRCSKAKQWILR